MSEPILVTGGAGYVGAALVEDLLEAGRDVRVFDLLLHDQRAVADDLAARGAEVVQGDILDETARVQALEGAVALVHLAAIVGDPACAGTPGARRQSRRLAGAHRGARKADVSASSSPRPARTTENDGSSCSHRGIRAAPVSLYAETKVGVEKALLSLPLEPMSATVMRFSTLYGLSPRMRFDLTVNEFRDGADRKLVVYGEQFWRPYVHVRDAARAVAMVMDAPTERVAGHVFNVGDTRENYRKAIWWRSSARRSPAAG